MGATFSHPSVRDNARTRGSINMVKQFIINVPLDKYKMIDDLIKEIQETHPTNTISRNAVLNQCLAYGMQVFRQIHIPAPIVQLAGANEVPEWKGPTILDKLNR